MTHSLRAMVEVASRHRVIRVAALGLTQLVLRGAPLPAQSESAGAVQAAALSWYINSQLAANGQRIASICLAQGAAPRNAKDATGPMNAGADVPDAVITRVVRSVIPVRSANECGTDPALGLRIVDKETRRQAVSLLIGTPVFDSPDRASVLLDFRFSARNGGGFNCFAVRENNRWTIADCKSTWIS